MTVIDRNGRMVELNLMKVLFSHFLTSVFYRPTAEQTSGGFDAGLLYHSALALAWWVHYKTFNSTGLQTFLCLYSSFFFIAFSPFIVSQHLWDFQHVAGGEILWDHLLCGPTNPVLLLIPPHSWPLNLSRVMGERIYVREREDSTFVSVCVCVCANTVSVSLHILLKAITTSLQFQNKLSLGIWPPIWTLFYYSDSDAKLKRWGKT